MGQSSISARFLGIFIFSALAMRANRVRFSVAFLLLPLLTLGKPLLSHTTLTSSALAAVIETQEWSSLPGHPWQFGGGITAARIDTSTNTPSGGGALKFVYPAGSQSESITGGIAEYVFQSPTTEFYFGHWLKWSSNWVWHPIGAKIDYFMANTGSDGSQSNVLTAVWGDYSNTGGCRGGYIQTVQRQDGGTYNMPQIGSVQFCPNQWYWVEWHLKMNTPGQANGIYEWWINDTKVASVFDMNLASPAQNGFWQLAQHSPEYGGGGQATRQTEQYLWVDHTVISTTRIGMPGTTPSGGDTTPPSSPVGLRIQ